MVIHRAMGMFATVRKYSQNKFTITNVSNMKQVLCASSDVGKVPSCVNDDEGYGGPLQSR